MSREAAGAFGAAASHFDSVEALAESAPGLAAGFASVLVKGSRFMRMERVVKALAADGAPTPAAAGGHH